jgi:lysozyme family protein
LTTFEKALAFVLEREGGYSNDPRDPGGETNYGISKRAYPNEDIKGMTRERAAEIYFRDYWSPCKCGELPWPLALTTFDIAVNQGTGTAAHLLQESVGTKTDGIIGLVTLEAVRHANLKQSLAILTALRCDRYSKAKNVSVYGKGWFRRAAHCLIAALEPL